MEIIQALKITAIGMALVFLGIIILWGMMALLVAIFKTRSPKVKPAETNGGSELQKKAAAAAVAVAKAGSELRQQAAAAAVATLFAFSGSAAMTIERPGIAASPWQIVHRLDQINLRNQTFTRKPRGNR